MIRFFAFKVWLDFNAWLKTVMLKLSATLISTHTFEVIWKWQTHHLKETSATNVVNYIIISFCRYHFKRTSEMLKPQNRKTLWFTLIRNLHNLLCIWIGMELFIKVDTASLFCSPCSAHRTGIALWMTEQLLHNSNIYFT